MLACFPVADDGRMDLDMKRRRRRHAYLIDDVDGEFQLLPHQHRYQMMEENVKMCVSVPKRNDEGH